MNPSNSVPQGARIVVATHHKAGTTYCLRVFGELCRALGWGFWDMESARKPQPWRIAFHGNATADRLRPALLDGSRLVHVVRHPKALVASAARYHLDADEAWLDEPQQSFGGRTYRSALSDLATTRERIRFEMEHKSKETIGEMVGLATTVLDVPRLSVKLEDLSHDTTKHTYLGLLDFLGLTGDAHASALALCIRHALWSMDELPRHARGGVGDDWRGEFDAGLDADFEKAFGHPERTLGYRRPPFPSLTRA